MRPLYLLLLPLCLLFSYLPPEHKQRKPHSPKQQQRAPAAAPRTGACPQVPAGRTAPCRPASAYFTDFPGSLAGGGTCTCCPELPELVPGGAGFFTGIGQRSDQYICARKGGTCNFSPCPLFTRIDGTCYRGKAKCCMR